MLKSNDPPIILAKVDCTEGGKSVCNRFSVQGYPTLKIFKGTEVSAEYNGPREAAGIIKYMKSQVGPSAKELTDVAMAEAFLASEEVGVVGLFSKASGPLHEAFLKLADKLRESVRFGVSTSGDVAEKLGGADRVVLFRPKHLSNKFEADSVVFDGAATKEALNTWIEANYHGLVGHRTTDNAVQFRQPLLVAYYTVDYVKNVKGTNYWRNRILKVAKSFADDFRFAVSNKHDFQQEITEFGFDFIDDEKPRVAIKDAKSNKFVMKDAFSWVAHFLFCSVHSFHRQWFDRIENLEKFLNDVKAGNLEPHVKSEPLPDNSGPLKTAVAKNFDEVVINNDKDTLVEFYAPWCGHCKKLMPVYEQVAEALKDEDVAIVKMDATANDVPANFEVRGFPTLYWLPRNDKDNHIRYEVRNHSYTPMIPCDFSPTKVNLTALNDEHDLIKTNS